MAQPIEDSEFDNIAQAQAVEDDEFEQLAQEQGGGPTVSEERTDFQAPAPEVSQQAPGLLSGWDEPQTWKDAGRAAYNGLQFGVGAPIAGLEAARSELLHGGGEVPDGKSGFQHLLDTYRQGRDARVAEDEAAQARSPKATLAGNVVGGAIPAVASGGASLSGGIGAAALRAGGAGALEGAVAGAGTSKADLTRGEVGGVAKDAALGGAAGLVAGGIFGGAGKALEGLPDSVRQFARRQFLRATGLTSKDAQLVDARHGREALDALGDRASQLVDWGDTPEEIARKAAEAASTSGGSVSGAVSELDALRTPGVGPRPTAVSQGIRNDVQKRGLHLQPAADDLAGQMEGLAKKYELLPTRQGRPAGSDMRFTDWWRSRIALDDGLQKGFERNPASSTAPLSEELKQQVRKLQEDEMERAAKALSPDVAGRYGVAKDTYRQDATLAHAAEARRNRLAGAPFDAADEARNDFGRDALVSLAAPQTGARRLLEGLVDPIRASPSLARTAVSAPVRFGAAAAGMAGTVAEPLVSSATRSLVQRVVAQKPSTEEKVEAYLQLAPEELGPYAGGLKAALEKNGRRGLAVYFWAKGGSDPEFQRLLKSIQDGSLGGEASQ